jgi:hypothetical protein
MRVLICGLVSRRGRKPGRKNLTRGRCKLKSCTKRMTDVKLAILRTFETTVKALLGGGEMPVFDGEGTANIGQICDHLQSIRAELSEVKNRLSHIEKHQHKNVIIDGGSGPTASLWQDDACAGLDDEDIESNDGGLHSAFVGMPIPLKQVEEKARPATPPVLPDIEPPAVVTNDAMPDIVDHKDPNSMDIEGESDDEEDGEADADGEEDGDADAEADADSKGKKDDEEEKDADGEEDGEEEDGEADAEEEDEEGLALEEITFKGKTYYKDSENTVYILDENDDLSDPLGVWNEITKTVRFFAKK